MKTEESHHDQDLQKAIRYSSRSILVNSEILIRKNWDLKKKKKTSVCLLWGRVGRESTCPIISPKQLQKIFVPLTIDCFMTVTSLSRKNVTSTDISVGECSAALKPISSIILRRSHVKLKTLQEKGPTRNVATRHCPNRLISWRYNIKKTRKRIFTMQDKAQEI